MHMWWLCLLFASLVVAADNGNGGGLGLKLEVPREEVEAHNALMRAMSTNDPDATVPARVVEMLDESLRDMGADIFERYFAAEMRYAPGVERGTVECMHPSADDGACRYGDVAFMYRLVTTNGADEDANVALPLHRLMALGQRDD